MAINLTKVGTAAAVGVADVLIERTEIGGKDYFGMTGQEWFHLLAVAGGHAAGMFDRKYFGMGETVATAATPLLIHDLANRFVKPDHSKHLFTPRAVAGPSVRNWAPSAGMGSYRPMRVTG